MKGINILIVSENDEGNNHIFTALSEQEGFITESVKDEVNAIINSERLKPDVLIIDLQPSILDILELAAIIHRKTPSTSIILFCSKNTNINKAFNIGIKGFLHKEANAEEITFAIFAVLRGSFYISGLCMNYIINDTSPVNQHFNISISLSLAERNIILCIAKGFNDNEIAKHLNYSIGTIRNIIVDIKRKMKLKNRIQIVLYSIVSGIINLKIEDLLKVCEVK